MGRSGFLGRSAAVLLAAGATFLGPVQLHAQMAAPSGVWTLTGFDVRTYWWGIVPTGGDFVALYNGIHLFPGLDTIFENDFGAGYEADNFYRNPDGSPYWGPTGSGSPVLFDRLEVLEGAGHWLQFERPDEVGLALSQVTAI